MKELTKLFTQALISFGGRFNTRRMQTIRSMRKTQISQRQLGNIWIAAADLYAVLTVTFMICLGTLAPLVHTEVLTFMESKKTDKLNDPAARDLRHSALAEVIYVGDEDMLYVLHQPNTQTRQFARYAILLEALAAKTPDDLRVRVDRRVPSGIYQDLLLDANKLGIRVWQTNESK